jgi:hypothetical protein
MLVPTLPSVVAAAPGNAAHVVGAAPAGMTPQQLASVWATQSAANPRSSTTKRGQQHSFGARVVRTMFVATLVAGVGAGSRFGWNAYQERSDEAAEPAVAPIKPSFLPAIGAPLSTAEPVLPVGGFVDATFRSSDPTVGQTTELHVRAGVRTDNVVIKSTLQGPEAGSAQIDVRNGRVLVRPGEDPTWYEAPADADVRSTVRDSTEWVEVIFTMHDFVPIESHPFVRVVSETDEQLPVIPLDPPSTPTAAAQQLPEDSPSTSEVLPPTVLALPPGSSNVARPSGPVSVRHYRLEIDATGFAAAEPDAYSTWVQNDYIEGTSGVISVNLWVDGLGIVRQLERTDLSGESFTYTLYDVADGLPNFQTESIAVTRVLGEQG